MGANETLTLTYQAVTTGWPAVNSNNSATGTGTTGGSTLTATDSTSVYAPHIDLDLDKQVSDATPYVGSDDFTLVVTNSSTVTATNIVVTDGAQRLHVWIFDCGR
jgi:hypothetical protein